jgi:hypothetical protein
MNTFSRTEAIALARVDQDRLQRLAELARRSPRAMLKFVLRHGFDEVERDIRETLAAERDAALHGTVAHADVMRSVRRIVEATRARKLAKAP